MFVLLVSCSNNRNSDEKAQSRDTTQSFSGYYLDSVKKKKPGKPNLYVFKNDSLTQMLKVWYRSDQEISFELSSNNRVNGTTATISGTAKGNTNQDPEMDEDDDGNSYASTDYYYKKDSCSISIRIALKTLDKANVLEYNCSKLHEPGCPLESVGVLRMVR